MLSVDLTIPIALLCAALVLVLAARAYATWAEHRIEQRTHALLETPGLLDPEATPAETREAPSSDEEGPRA